MNEVRLPLALSVAGHVVGLALLAWLSGRLPPLRPPPPPPKAVDVIFEVPPSPVTPPAPAPVPEVKPPPPVPQIKPPPVVQPPPRRIEPPKPKLERAPPVRREAPVRVERPEAPPPRPAPERPPVAPPPPVMPPRTTALPPVARPPSPAATVSPGYRNALAQWFAGHKRYPESARERGEEGEAVLRFRVDRSGRVLSYTLVRGTGYADLDAEVAAMMRGAVLPPFPADMAASEIEVSVPVRFSLVR